MDTTALTVPSATVLRENRLEDLARRLSREIDIKRLDEMEGRPAQRFLSGQSSYNLFYHCDCVDGDELINIHKTGIPFPMVHIFYCVSDGYSLKLDIQDSDLGSFTEGHRDCFSQPLNPLYHKIAKKIAEDINRLKPKGELDPNFIIPFEVAFDLGDLKYITSDLVKHYLC